MLDQDAAVQVEGLAQVAVALLPEPLRIAGGEPREDVPERRAPCGSQPFQCSSLKMVRRGQVHAMAALVHEVLQRQRGHSAEDVGELRIRSLAARRCGSTRVPAGTGAAADSAFARRCFGVMALLRTCAPRSRNGGRSGGALFNHSSAITQSRESVVRARALRLRPPLDQARLVVSCPPDPRGCGELETERPEITA